MTDKYDIFKHRSHGSFVWVEAVEDIVAAKKRLGILVLNAPGDYRLWNMSLQKFVNPLDECA
jgi:hypothetical protein